MPMLPADPSVTNEMPSAAGSRNKRTMMPPAPDGGGVLPHGGNKFPAPNKFKSTTGQPFFADGGVVGGEQEQPMQQPAPADLMSVIRGALQYGRQQSGLPSSFSQGPEPAPQPAAAPSFDEGGVVPDVPQEGVPDPSMEQPQGAPSMPDPRKAMSYLTGDGAIAPDIVDALGRSVDPDGTMDAGERFSKTLTQAPSPDAAWGILQHGRTRFNAYSAAAKVAMDKGDMGRAAMYATQAFDHVPTGQSVKFAPGRGGLTMLTRPHQSTSPAPQASAFGMGGAVDASNPDNSAGVDDSQEDASFAGGGQVPYKPGDDDYADFPYSEGNFEDRRDEHTNSGVVPRQSDGPSLESMGAGQAQITRETERVNRDRIRGLGRNSGSEGVVRKQSFADGGEVEEGVLPADAASEEPVEEVTSNETAPATTGAAPTPAQLNRQQLIALLDAGYDKIIEGAMEQPAPAGTPDDVDVTGAVTPDTPAADRPNSPMDPMAGPPQKTPSRNPLGGVVDAAKDWLSQPNMFKQDPNASPSMDALKNAGGVISNAAGMLNPNNWPTGEDMRGKPGKVAPTRKEGSTDGGVLRDPSLVDPQAPSTPEPNPEDEQTYAQRKPKKAPNAAAPKQSDPQEQWNKQYDILLERANKLFPWVSQGEQRRNYIMGQMQGDQAHSQRMELEGTKGAIKASEGDANRASREGIADKRNEGADLRNRRSTMSHERIAAGQQMTSMFNSAQNREASLIRSQLANDPNYQNSPEFKQAMVGIQRLTKKSPEQIMDMFAAMPEGPASQAQGQGGSQGQPRPQAQGQSSNAMAAAPKDAVFRSKDGTKQYRKVEDGPDGKWELVRQGK